MSGCAQAAARRWQNKPQAVDWLGGRAGGLVGWWAGGLADKQAGGWLKLGRLQPDWLLAGRPADADWIGSGQARCHTRRPAALVVEVPAHQQDAAAAADQHPGGAYRAHQQASQTHTQ